MEYTNATRRAEQLAAFGRLLDVLDRLRAECPWDRKQTLQSLRHLTIEETYELGDAILRNDLPDLKKELGDVMLHLTFYAKIASEQGAFDIADVLNAQCEKLIFRHPHIYGNTQAETEEDVKRNWEQLKLQEKGNTSVLGGVPVSLPALVKAMRIQEKARGAGFDWEKSEQVWAKVQEELTEFSEEFAQSDPATINQERATAEFGDLIFSLINFARHAGINPEEALERTNRKFIQRFQYLETESTRDGHSLKDLTLAQMDRYWEQAKKLAITPPEDTAIK
ncbi:nucleoside triphosphate pyrophosphohydrolase [Hymenobacter taeanensis]|uniref:Nucleoside triphosphate pyrophosphohydrolase n=1 Tax=Hymenobacter taeanensis TaxID=2735321 RepID=A0A6M6BEZ3_9BACT|nr:MULTISPECIES: nucleoside triphosphate pyrophosphohydrolase [Hymenobacter]QJX47151.1 nucleoside triphosphate pyrophosphohydrolase [Hymenobacter taeanensis]UOQ81069.1 nucleoside triphosphate pyrophosphohydrolase [Hymenobacter sp. 5414T-23]